MSPSDDHLASASNGGYADLPSQPEARNSSLETPTDMESAPASNTTNGDIETESRAEVKPARACRAYIQGFCPRGDKCSKGHPKGEELERLQLKAEILTKNPCPGFLLGDCDDEDCTYWHPEVEKLERIRKEKGIDLTSGTSKGG